MASTQPNLKFDKPFTMRVDDAFFEKLDDLRTATRPVRSRSDFIRKIVEEMEIPPLAKRSARR